jgi:phosphatidylglycerophosphate synthase
MIARESWYGRCMEWSRQWRMSWLGPVVRPLKRIGVKPNHLTLLSLISGLVTIWFAFERHGLFIVFGLLHMFLDSIDGVLAREMNATEFGAYFDSVVDNLVVVLLLGKAFFVFGGVFFGVVAIVYVIHQLVYLLSGMRAQAVFGRTVFLILYFFGLYDIGAIYIAVITAYGFGMQACYFLKK